MARSALEGIPQPLSKVRLKERRVWGFEQREAAVRGQGGGKGD
jgi:hypothetical protein